MSRTSRVRALAVTALLAAAGCQDYNFNPVGECLIKPNLKQVTLSDITTADVLFVVDDSGSMLSEQQKLAGQFDNFVNNLDATNQQRVAEGLEPIDFHLAVTTTSVFESRPDSSNPVCLSGCPDPGGGTVAGEVCCKTLNGTPVGPYRTVQKCTGASDTSCPTDLACRSDCNSFSGEYVCCNPTTKVPELTQNIPCTLEGQPCGNINSHYRSDPSCTMGNMVDGAPYPQGQLVAAGSNPAVVHFDKELYNCAGYPTCTNKGGYDATALKDFFKANVQVGTCGSDQEQGLEAARRAIEYWSEQPAASREFLHAKSKLVLVFVSDEDDCSTPQDANAGVILSYDPAHPGMPRYDSCAAQGDLPAEEQKLLQVSGFTEYFTDGLDPQPPVGAAFIVSAKAGSDNVCVDQTCVADICCDTSCDATCALASPTCGGQSKGSRLVQAAEGLRSKDADVVEASICDGDFATILNRIAEIVKPPSGLLLPSQPAAEEVTVVRIARNGATRKTCRGPAPAAMDAAQAAGLQTYPADWPDAGLAGTAVPSPASPPYDWWFTGTREQNTWAQKHPTVASPFVLINHDTNNCEASPGETYSAEYIGRLPDAGCTGEGATDDEARQAADASCAAMLGGSPADWTCFAGTDSAGACTVPTGSVVGTCLCGARYIPPPASAPAGTPGQGNCPLN